MSWDFSTEPDFQEKLDWIDDFVRREIEPLDLLFGGYAYTRVREPLATLVDQLKQEVKQRGLWAAHLGPELGGQGFGQLKLALINEILGRSGWAPIVFGTAAPDTGNAEIIAAYGTPEQKQRWLEPLLNGEVFSCYSMSEPQGGADPTLIRTRAVRDGDEWVISGEKFFSSNLRDASFILVMAVTDPAVDPHDGMSMFFVPSDTPGIQVLCNIGLGGMPFGHGTHAHVRYENVRVPAENLLGGEGKAFEVAQRRLGGGRIHHAMRSVASAKKQLDMMCERALSRYTQGSLLSEKQMVQEAIADSWIQYHQFRLMVMHAAWKVDQTSTREAKMEIAACKVVTAKVLTDISAKATHIHGSLGASNLMSGLGAAGGVLGIVDGPTEVHKVTVARELLKRFEPSPDMWPTNFRPRKLVQARRAFDEMLEQRVPDAAKREEFDGLLQRSAGNDVQIEKMQQYLDATIGNL